MGHYSIRCPRGSDTVGLPISGRLLLASVNRGSLTLFAEHFTIDGDADKVAEKFTVHVVHVKLRLPYATTRTGDYFEISRIYFPLKN